MRNLIEISNKKPKILSYYFDIFKNKYLIFQITKREFITAYTQSLLGIFYHALVPLVQTIVFNFFLNKVNFNPSNEIPSFLFYFIGITIWNLFFNNSLKVSNILLINRKTIARLYFNRFTLVISSCLINLVHFIINLIILIAIMLFLKFYFELSSLNLNIKLFIIPLIALNAFILSAGIGMIVSSLSIRYRDLVFGLTFLFQLLMFISPVLYSIDAMDNNYLLFFLLNPVTSFLELFRWVFIEDYNLNLFYISINALTAILIFLIGTKMFIIAERKVADFI